MTRRAVNRPLTLLLLVAFLGAVLSGVATSATVTQEASGTVEVEEPIYADQQSFEVTVTELENPGAEPCVGVWRGNSREQIYEDVAAGDSFTVDAEDVGGYGSGTELRAVLHGDVCLESEVDSDTTTVTAEGDVEVEEPIYADQQSFEVTVVELRGAGAEPCVDVQNGEHDRAIFEDVEAGDTITVDESDVGSFRNGHQLTAVLHADVCLESEVDADSTTVEADGSVEMDSPISTTQDSFEVTVTGLRTDSGTGCVALEHEGSTVSYREDVSEGDVLTYTRDDVDYRADDELVAHLRGQHCEIPLDSASTIVTDVGSIWGVITDANDGSELQGVSIEVYADADATSPVATARTDASGEYLADDLDPGDYHVEASLDGYRSGSTSVTVESGETAGGAFSLEPESSSLQGTVVRADDGSWLGGATVRVFEDDVDGTEVAVVEADGDGSYAVPSVDAGEYALQASVDGFDDGTATAVVEPGEVETVTLELSPQVGTIEGTVVGSDTGAGIADATVDALDGSGSLVTRVETDADGSYRVEDLLAVDYQLEAAADGYQAETQGATVRDGETTSGVDFELGVGSDGRAGEGGPTFDVTIDDVRGPTSDGGTYETEATVHNTGGAADTQDVTLTVDGRVLDRRQVSLGAGESSSLSFAWEASATEDEAYNVEVASEDDLDSSAIQASDDESEDEGGGFLGGDETIGLLVLAFLLLVGGYYYVRRRRASG